MGNENTVKGTKRLATGNTFGNAVSFLIDGIVRDTVNTAEVVKVVSIYPGGSNGMTGYVDALPLVCQTDADHNTLPPSTLYRLPYSRIQGGVAALVIDPEPGDIGIAVFTKRDSSNVKQAQSAPVQPGSFRTFAQADGFYIGGFLNKAPSIWLELKQNNEAVLHAPVKVTVETQECIIDAPLTRLTGSLLINGNVTWAGTGQGQGGPAVFKGGLTNSGGSIKSNNVTLETHTHSGVETGPSNTGGPNGG